MSLVLQELPDGFRAVSCEGGQERMIAHVVTKYNAGYTKIAPMTPEEFSDRMREVGAEVALKERDARANSQNLVTQWKPLRRGECKIHSAIGALSVEHVEEMLSAMPAE